MNNIQVAVGKQGVYESVLLTRPTNARLSKGEFYIDGDYTFEVEGVYCKELCYTHLCKSVILEPEADLETYIRVLKSQGWY
jgi:hypothetical protein